MTPGHVRFAGLVSEAGSADGAIWVDVPEALAADVTDRLDTWLLWILPHAFATGQDLVIDGAVDAELLRNADALMEIWSRWRPDRRPIRVVAEPVAPTAPGPRVTPARTGLFFTCGVDSFFTLYHHDHQDASAGERGAPGWRPVDDLVYVHGFDIPLEHVAAFEAKRKVLARVAADTGKTLVLLATNLRETGVRQPWGLVMHGPALGGVGVLLGNRWGTALFSSTFRHDDSGPWGSTGITDPLLSTSLTRARPYGEAHDRVEKLEYLMGFPLVLDTLHVCWEERSEKNCGRCGKCVRTLTALDILGVRDRATTFPPGAVALARLAAFWKDVPHVERFYAYLRDHAARAGRADIVAVIDSCRRAGTSGGPPSVPAPS